MFAICTGLAGMWMQDPGSLSSGNSTLLTVFVALAAFAMLVQAVALVAMAIGAAKALKRGIAIAEEVRVKALPIIESSQGLIRETQELIRENAPKVKGITENLMETSDLVRNKARDFEATATDVNLKTRAQVARVDGMVSSVLNTSAEIADTIQRGIKIPVREVSGVVNGLKAGLDVLVGRAKGFGSGRVDVARDRSQGW